MMVKTNEHAQSDVGGNKSFAFKILRLKFFAV